MKGHSIEIRSQFFILPPIENSGKTIYFMLYLSNYNNLHILYVLILDFKWHVSFILNRINMEIAKVRSIISELKL